MSLEEDVSLCAREIVADLLASLPMTHRADVLYLCEIHAQRPLVDRNLCKPIAYCDGERIYVAGAQTADFYQEALPHELTHTLARQPRWESLNYCLQSNAYDQSTFEEKVATLVGKTFLIRDR